MTLPRALLHVLCCANYLTFLWSLIHFAIILNLNFGSIREITNQFTIIDVKDELLFLQCCSYARYSS